MAVLKKASGVITTIGGELHQSLKAKVPHQKFVTLANGFDEELMNNIVSLPPKDVFHVVYTGLLTQQQAYFSILKALLQLKGDRPIRFSLAGNISDSILKEIRSVLPHVEVIYHGYLDHSAAIALMKSGHLLLNFIFAGATRQMISGKLLEYFATQIPVLSIGYPLSDAGEFIAQGSCAKMIESEDQVAINEFIQALFEGNKAQKNMIENIDQWSRKAITQRLIKTVLS
jgi:glycosyltransferase involved in cell wall biosynthesis